MTCQNLFPFICYNSYFGAHLFQAQTTLEAVFTVVYVVAIISLLLPLIICLRVCNLPAMVVQTECREGLARR